MGKIVQIDNVSYRSDEGYTFGLYVHNATFQRSNDNKILVLSSYRLPNSVFVVEWPGIVHWSDGTRIAEEVEILMQIVLDVNSLASGWRITSARGPVPGQL